jgi:type II secretion system protein N
MWAVYAALGFCTFVVGVQLVFPYARMVDAAAASLSGAYEVRFERLERGVLPGRFALRGVRVSSRAGGPFVAEFDRIDVSVGLRPLVDGAIEARVDGRGPAGRLRGRIDQVDGGVAVDLVATGMPLALRAARAQVSGAPAVHLRLLLPGGALSAARGDASLSCDACAVDPPAPAGRLEGRIAVVDGTACLERLASPAGDLRLRGAVRLVEEPGARAEGAVRFRLDDGAGPCARPGRIARPALAPPRAPIAASMAAPPAPIAASMAAPDPAPAAPVPPPQPAALEPEIPIFAPRPGQVRDEPPAQLVLEY